MNPQRHDLVFIDSQAHFSIQSAHYDSNAIRAHVTEWLKNGLPCIYARQFSHDTLNLGLPLFFDNKKHRVSLSVDKAVVIKQMPLPQLAEMQDFFLNSYGVKLLSDLPINIAVYGSFLFHYLSHQKYVEETSDLDLLINYSVDCSLDALSKLIKRLNNQFNRVIDGEIRFTKLGDISIKELFDLSAKTLLCKKTNTVELLSRAELYARYPLL
jgi:phosphoribosyl-dephospho-CoA transferase